MSNALMSAELDQLFAALATANENIGNIEQNREVEVQGESKGGNRFKYKFTYATLANIVHTIRGELPKNGIWYMQRVADGHMITRLFHKSGQWMDAGHVPMPNVNGKPAEVGAVVSFFKRYSLSAAMGLATEEDNAGEDGGRDVNFRARGERRDQPDDHRPVETGVEEPPEGWGDWARDFIVEVNKTGSEDELDTLKERDKRYINGAARIDRYMYDAVGKAIKDRRAVLNDSLPF